MFTPKLGSSGTKFSPFSNTPNAKSTSKNRRSVSLYTPQRKSPYTPRQSALNRSVQQTSQLAEPSKHVVEGYGPSLPVLITEALTVTERNVESSMTVSPNGWAWLVCGRRLFVWRYRHNQPGKTGQCKELTLPPSDLAHRAGLIVVLPYPSDVNAASCVAVSPEGVIRYWSSLSHEGSFAETSCELKGEESAKLISLENNQCILATTTSTLLLVTPTSHQNLVTCRPLSGQSGLFSGISRRMSSLFYNTVTSQSVGAPLHSLVAGPALGTNSQVFYVLSGTFLQKWVLTDSVEKLLFQCNADKLMREFLADSIWRQDPTKIPNLKSWLLDIQIRNGDVVVLGAGVNTDVSAEMHYACGILHTEADDPPQSFLSFSVSQHKDRYSEEEEAELTGHKLLISDQTSAAAFMYDKKTVICVTVAGSAQNTDRVDFQSPGDQILGAGSYGGVALFFSVCHGLVSIKTPQQHESTIDTSYMELPSQLENSSLAPPSSSNVTLDEVSEDLSDRLKAAFLQSCSGHLDQAQSLVDDLFPPSLRGHMEAGGKLDTMVTDLSRDLIDDYPASDPRWAESVAKGGSTSNTTSLILLHQLEDKQKAHDFYISFLKKVGLWDVLSAVSVGGNHFMATPRLLCENAEKLSAAVTLHCLHADHVHLVDSAIRRVLEKKGQGRPPNGLTTHDVFYREVSLIHEIFGEMYDMEQEALQSDKTSQEVVSLISSVNTIVVQMLFNACQYRETNVATFQNAMVDRFEYVPWTSSVGSNGTRQLLVNLHSVTAEKALLEAKDNETRAALFQHLVALTDIILDGSRSQLESINQTQDQMVHYNVVLGLYEQTRQKLINVFMAHQQFEQAASLAEKYCDFTILIQLCEITNNQERLQRYMTQFQDKGFSDFVFKWYMEEGKRGKLLSQSFIAKHPALTSFLSSQENQFISWLHDVHTKQYYKAHRTLKGLGINEKINLSKKKTLISLSKLAALAVDSPTANVLSDVQELNDDLDLILHQETLPAAVVEKLGIDVDNMSVLSAQELIEIYISDSNEESNEFDFKKALDLLDFINMNECEMSLEELRLHIWCQAVLKDEWSAMGGDDPLENCQNFLFMRLAELIYSEGGDLKTNIPDVNMLLGSDELDTLRDNPQFQFLLRATYEHLNRKYNGV